MSYVMVGKMEPIEADTIVMSHMAESPRFYATTDVGTLATVVRVNDVPTLGLIGSPQREIGQTVETEEGIHHAYGHRGRTFYLRRAKKWGVYIKGDGDYSGLGLVDLLDAISATQAAKRQE